MIEKKPYTNFEQHRAALHLNVILDLFQLITNEKKQSKKKLLKITIAITENTYKL